MERRAANRAAVARAGEAAAARHLESIGYRIAGMNVRVGHDEADLVAITPRGSVAVVEVKSRTGTANPEDRVDRRKRARLTRLAEALACRPGLRGRMFQFDVVAVSFRRGAAEVHHWPRAFAAGE